jgi:hypothetical protein
LKLITSRASLPIHGVVQTKSTNLFTLDEHHDAYAHERLPRGAP